ncbi:hypothetical protein [Streptomyces sp. NPDC010273]|uniref:hypothetical protein n=1 Tax=Streptomyces sp. NPDC010273 TaxID=3364829 RepID=UPI0036E87B01
MPEPDWLIKARNDLGKAVRTAHGRHEDPPCRGCEDTAAAVALVFARETKAAYQRGLMAGRSQAGYRKRKEESCAPSAETPSRASSTESEP